MNATYAYDEQPWSGHPLRPGAAPQDIRAALLPADRAEFDTAYDQALNEARTSRDLTTLFTTLEHWRRIAVLQSDPENYRRVVRRAAELLSGETIPVDESFAVTKARVGM